LEKRKARAQDRRLKLVEPRVHARLTMVVLCGLSAVSQPFDSFGQRPIVGDGYASVAERSQILRRVEAEGARHAYRSDGSAFRRREMCLAAVLDNREIVARCEPFYPWHVGR